MDKLKVTIYSREYVNRLMELIKLHNELDTLATQHSGYAKQYLELMQMGDQLPQQVREDALKEVRRCRENLNSQEQDIERSIERKNEEFLAAAKHFEEVGGKPSTEWVKKASK